MEDASPARLYAAAGGAFLLLLGVVGFFYSASFGSPGEVEEALGQLHVNGWLNCFYAAMGVLGLLAAGGASRPFALFAGVVFTGLAIWGFALGGGEAVLGRLPTGGANEALNLTLGLLGFAAAAGTTRKRGSKETRGVRKEPRSKEPRPRSASGSRSPAP